MFRVCVRSRRQAYKPESCHRAVSAPLEETPLRAISTSLFMICSTVKQLMGHSAATLSLNQSSSMSTMANLYPVTFSQLQVLDFLAYSVCFYLSHEIRKDMSCSQPTLYFKHLQLRDGDETPNLSLFHDVPHIPLPI